MIEAVKRVLKNLLYAAGRARRSFITLHTRPIFSSDLVYEGSESANDVTCAIVIQGPIRHEDDFTLETIKFYLRNYPSAKILFSTWEDEDVSAIKILESGNFKIILNSKPYPGSSNINMQVTSTRAGIDQAVRMGCKYILKTRSDQRMYGTDSLKFFKNMLKIFPVLGCNSQHQRILTVNTGTNRSIPHHLSDLFMFGHVDDMKLYWHKDIIIEPSKDPCKLLYVESYLLTNFLQKTGWKIKNTMENFMLALGERCIVVDNESVDVYWHKYTRYREYRLKDYNNPRFGIHFKTWLNDAYIPALNAGDKKT